MTATNCVKKIFLFFFFPGVVPPVGQALIASIICLSMLPATFGGSLTVLGPKVVQFRNFTKNVPQKGEVWTHCWKTGQGFGGKGRGGGGVVITCGGNV